MELIFYSVFITEIYIIKNKDVEIFLFYYILKLGKFKELIFYLDFVTEI